MQSTTRGTCKQCECSKEGEEPLIFRLQIRVLANELWETRERKDNGPSKVKGKKLKESVQFQKKDYDNRIRQISSLLFF